jgi:DNA invertase Pin-like site-specific DNA recombinase
MDTTQKPVALYARVSTADKGQDTNVQLRELRDHCSRRNLTVGAEFVDEGISGTKDSRPALDKLMAGVLQGEYSGVIVWKFDRFARSVPHLLRALESFNKLGVHFVSLTEGVDTSTPIGKFTLTVLGAVGELERNMMIERTKAGMKNAAAKGIHCGRPRKVIQLKVAS